VVGSALRTDIRGDKFDPRIPGYFLEGQYKHMKHNGLTEQKHELIWILIVFRNKVLSLFIDERIGADGRKTWMN